MLPVPKLFFSSSQQAYFVLSRPTIFQLRKYHTHFVIFYRSMFTSLSMGSASKSLEYTTLLCIFYYNVLYNPHSKKTDLVYNVRGLVWFVVLHPLQHCPASRLQGWIKFQLELLLRSLFACRKGKQITITQYIIHA